PGVGRPPDSDGSRPVGEVRPPPRPAGVVVNPPGAAPGVSAGLVSPPVGGVSAGLVSEPAPAGDSAGSVSDPVADGSAPAGEPAVGDSPLGLVRPASGEARPGDVRPGEVRPGEVRPGDVR